MSTYPEITVNTYPEITVNTKINELPEFEIKKIKEVPENHPTRQFFNTIFIYIRQVIKLFFHYNIKRKNGAEQFYDELSTDCIEQIHHGEKKDRIFFLLCDVCDGGYPLWLTLSITNDPHEGNIPFIQFLDGWYRHPLVSFGISLARNTVIYNYNMCFDRWLPIKDVPAEHVTEDVWKYCQYVIKQVRTHMPEHQFPEPNIKNVRISIIQALSLKILKLDVVGIPYSIQATNCFGNAMVVNVHKPVTEELVTYFTTKCPYDDIS